MTNFRPVVEAPFSTTSDGRRILQCHSRGDKRFSPFFCHVEAFGLRRSIEDHYQTAKVFESGEVTTDELQPANWHEAKRLQKAGKTQVAWRIGHIKIPPIRDDQTKSLTLTDFGIQFYIALWHKYLLGNPGLITIASQFDEFEDPFRGRFPFCQADVIRQCVHHGIDSLKPMYAELAGHLRNYTLPSDINQRFAYTPKEWIELILKTGKPRVIGEPTIHVCVRSGNGLTSTSLDSLPKSDRRILADLRAELEAEDHVAA